MHKYNFSNDQTRQIRLKLKTGNAIASRCFKFRILAICENKQKSCELCFGTILFLLEFELFIC